MKVKEIISQNRRDFTAIYKCEHCGFTKKRGGYDDDNFHQNVIPNMECPECKKKAGNDYRGLSTKYPEGFQI